MEYVFGANDLDGTRSLKTVGEEHTNLSGFVQTVREYPDCTITDDFYVVKKTGSADGPDGKCYDFYEIDKHSRTIDKTAPIREAEKQNAANIAYLSMMLGVDIPTEEDDEDQEVTVHD